MKKIMILLILSFCYSQSDNPQNEFNEQAAKTNPMIQNYKIITSNGMELIVESYILTGSGRIRLNDDRNREYPLYQIEKIIDLKNGEIVWKEGMYNQSTKTESKVKSYDGIGKPIGGLFIAAGSYLIYNQLQTIDEYSESIDGLTSDEISENGDKKISSQKLGFVLIGLGALMIGFSE